ncbi:DUF5956 family protein [Saccharothrix syringae]|uniref:Uncharacterized protein n=1 Tax=Saccharothrix syringae TaxID=103733 RepID=A0A5Q0H2J8_SACSY|nr:DUF5956 family protein [Saccharothrix syringae]QFZ20411.1 hypothetical protein EKG83_26005 [Saccharothrix syringae]
MRLLPKDTPVTTPPGLPGRPASARLQFEGATYDRVPDTGFTMLLAWLAGLEHLVRLPDRESHTVTVTEIRGTARITHSGPRTSTDQDTIDEGIEDYLADAGVPAPPRGHRWYQRLPHGHDTLDDVYAHVNTALRATDPEGTAIHPDQLKPILTDIMAVLYPH